MANSSMHGVAKRYIPRTKHGPPLCGIIDTEVTLPPSSAAKKTGTGEV